MQGLCRFIAKPAVTKEQFRRIAIIMVTVIMILTMTTDNSIVMTIRLQPLEPKTAIMEI